MAAVRCHSIIPLAILLEVALGRQRGGGRPAMPLMCLETLCCSGESAWKAGIEKQGGGEGFMLSQSNGQSFHMSPLIAWLLSCSEACKSSCLNASQ